MIDILKEYWKYMDRPFSTNAELGKALFAAILPGTLVMLIYETGKYLNIQFNIRFTLATVVGLATGAIFLYAHFLSFLRFRSKDRNK